MSEKENKKQNAFSTAFSCVAWPFVAFVAGYFVPFFVCKALSVDYATQLGTAVTCAIFAPATMAVITFLWGIFWKLFCKKTKEGESNYLFLRSACSAITALTVFAVYTALFNAMPDIHFTKAITSVFVFSKIAIMVSLLVGMYTFYRMFYTKEARISMFLETVAMIAIIFTIKSQNGCLEKLFGL